MKFIKLNVAVTNIDTWVNVDHIVQFYFDGRDTTVQLSTPMTLENGDVTYTIQVTDSVQNILQCIK